MNEKFRAASLSLRLVTAVVLAAVLIAACMATAVLAEWLFQKAMKNI